MTFAHIESCNLSLMQTSEKAISRKLYFSGFSVPLIQDLSEGVDPRKREGNTLSMFHKRR